jgi:hypothetical protein
MGHHFDIARDLFGNPHLSPLARVLEQRLAQLNAEGAHLCPAENVQAIAWFLAEAVIESFEVSERDQATS